MTGSRRRRLQIAVAGGGRRCSARTLRLARAVGAAVARHDAVLVCGGLRGVMAAAAQGASEEGGTVVGIVPGYEHADANRDCDVVVATGLGHARNVLVAASGDALIALPGEHGTLSEIALARVLGRLVIVLGRQRTGVPGVVYAASPEEAVSAACAFARRRLRAGAGRARSRRRA